METAVLDKSKSFYFEDGLQSNAKNEVMEFMNSTWSEFADRKGQQSKLIYIEKLMLGPVKFNVSYVKSVRSDKLHSNEILSISRGKYVPQVTLTGNKWNNDVAHRSSSKRRADVLFRRWSEFSHEDDWSTNVDKSTRNFHNVITAAFPTITDAPIRINGKAIDNIFESWSEIIANLKHFYLKEMIFQVHKVIGSVDFFGNPTMAVNSIMKGAHDFVMLPFREFLRSPNNPSKLGIGVAKGTISLLSHFFSGIFGFVSNISEAGGTAAAALSFDEHFKRWHKQQVADHFLHMHGQFRPQGWELLFSTVTRPLQDIVAGLLFAASGVFVEPYKGAQLKGMTGFSKGMGIGTIGLIAKPLVGVFDAFAHISESIHDVARSANILDKKSSSVRRMRLPYVFGIQKLLLPYNHVDAYCSNLLRLFPLRNEKRSQSEESEEVLILSQVLQKEPGVGWYVIVTTKRILKVIVRNDLLVPPFVEWQVNLETSGEIKSTVEHATHNVVVLQITSSPKLSSPRVKKQSEQGQNEYELDDDFEMVMMDKKKQAMKVSRQKHSKSNPVQNALGAFTTYKSKKKERTIHNIPGDFQTERDALIQVHNAICCITKQFDSIMPRNYSSTGDFHSDREGHTSFGPLHFGKEFEIASNARIDTPYNLDCIPWIHFGDSSNSTRMNDDIKISQSFCDGPQWMTNLMATSTFLPISVQSDSDLRIKIDTETEKSNKQVNASTTLSKEMNERCVSCPQQIKQDGVDAKSNTNTNDDVKALTVEERLLKVESLVRLLLNEQSNIELNMTGSSNKTPNTSSYLKSNVSAVSALTGFIDERLECNPPGQVPSNETDELKREVEFLRQQLAQKDLETEGQSRKKRKFKKFWRS